MTARAIRAILLAKGDGNQPGRFAFEQRVYPEAYGGSLMPRIVDDRGDTDNEQMPHHPVAYGRPTELAVFQALGDEHHAGAVPEDQLPPVSPLCAEHLDHTGEGIGAHRLAHQRRQPLRPFTEVDRLRAMIAAFSAGNQLRRRPAGEHFHPPDRLRHMFML